MNCRTWFSPRSHLNKTTLNFCFHCLCLWNFIAIIFVTRKNNCLKTVWSLTMTNLAISFLFSQIMLARKLQNVRLTFQNVFESNEGKLIELATLNKTDNSYRCFPCKILSKHSKWQLLQCNKPIPNLFIWTKFLLDQSSCFICKTFLVRNMHYWRLGC